MRSRDIPCLTLPVNDFEEMMHMSNRHLISLLRREVLSPERAARFRNHPPADHDAYLVRHDSTRITVALYLEGQELFRCVFVPPSSY